ncbi:TfuA-like protein [Paracoccus sp. MBLB3053]|uniref:TfuA-like protein n=1 Tax=Paracoccus aurantius TaxID=3073814 RepID=A0ABU2HXY4_9RHOB|nr:TfuA-like protein [Paracoccus sp. MBLB3053]MDS9469916.1 TfuA-like protein [Paracoccus sp. MBLB3053]
MNIIVFAGPSLRESDTLAHPDFDFRPPVRQGELYKAALSGPAAIGVIDGYFDGAPAVWHKEVLWALSQGIAVYGASSMGALRAAELHPFGMQGIGRIFEDYRDGVLTDDDEVALLHGPAETGFVALSEPMVNIRATVAAAVVQGVLDKPAAAALVRSAKRLFYQERNWQAAISAAEGFDAARRQRFFDWLARGRIDQKRLDALALLAALAEHRPPPPGPPGFVFEHTEAWANAPWIAAEQDLLSAEDARILDELRLDADRYLKLRQDALLQVLALDAAKRAGLEPDRDEVSETALSIRLPLGLFRQRDIGGWTARNGLSRDGFERLISDRASLAKLARQMDRQLGGAMLDLLRLAGDFESLRARADRKADGKGADGQIVPPQPMLMSWYFETRLGRPVPSDITAYLMDLGMSDPEHFHLLLAAEYRRCATDPAAPRARSGRSAETLLDPRKSSTGLPL